MLHGLPIALFQAKISITSEYSQLNCLLLFPPKERTKNSIWQYNNFFTDVILGITGVHTIHTKLIKTIKKMFNIWVPTWTIKHLKHIQDYLEYIMKIHIQWRHEDNPMRLSSSSLRCLCGDMPAMDGSGGVHALLVLESTECSTSTRLGA